MVCFLGFPSLPYPYTSPLSSQVPVCGQSRMGHTGTITGITTHRDGDLEMIKGFDSVLLGVPQFMLSIHKSTKQLGASFPFHNPKICSDLPIEVSSATYLPSFRWNLKTYQSQSLRC